MVVALDKEISAETSNTYSAATSIQTEGSLEIVGKAVKATGVMDFSLSHLLKRE